MLKVLDQTEFEVAMFIGDVYQIEPIKFGNWFQISKKMLTKSSIFELEGNHRTENTDLQEYWKNVRDFSDDILALTERFKISKSLESIFNSNFEDDQIILCLKYGGLLGINNLNSIFQEKNNNVAFQIGVNSFKINDPIIFNENNRFSKWLHNNLKGKIKKIKMKVNL
ncbi:hypothetical protein CK556_01720 [Mesoplasma chauliocola]|uniref:Helicase n=1 Tax=Mesoplasma chauliocola TaxID=216427 RepID=A0A249SN96_9MOLU|nr:hypothetical protein [Mesoplasma chauliocola]ASZ09073.1 hypothetical protein CK556_01720 [Mesoplasma chauliocola]